MIISPADRLDQVQEYYFSQKLREVRELTNQGSQIINLGIGNPDLAPSPATIQELCHAASNEQNHGYQPYQGIARLRSAMADWYKNIYNVKLNASSQVLPLIGSKEGIFHISMAFLNPGDQVLVPDPGYSGYVGATRLAGAEPIFYDLHETNDWLPDLNQLNELTSSKTKIIWINYPHMPTGAVATRDFFRNLISFANEKNILICHDNPYSLILNKENPLSILQVSGAFDCCLELNSLSKSHHMAGWRVGMVSGNSDYLTTVLTVKSNIDSGMFLPIQIAAAKALSNPAEWHHNQNQQYQKRQKLVYKLLDVLNFSYSKDTAGLFVWAKAPDKIKDVEGILDDLLYSRGIFLTPGKIFGKNGERYIRVSICAPEEKILQAIQRVQTKEPVRP